MKREVTDRVIALRAKRDVVWDLQASLLILACQLDREADAVERQEQITEESWRLLREAREYLGPGVREIASEVSV